MTDPVDRGRNRSETFAGITIVPRASLLARFTS